MSPPIARGMWVLWLAVLLPWAGCSQRPSERTQEQLEALQKKKAEQAQKARAATPPPVKPAPSIRLEPPYDDKQAIVIVPDGPCPPDFWALFAGDAPGDTAAEKKANAARRAGLADGVRGASYLVKLRAPTSVRLSSFDAAKGHFTIDVDGTIDCVDAKGRIAIAWTQATAAAPGAPSSDIVENIWQAPSVPFELPMSALSQAKAFEEKERLALSARVAFRVKSGDIDRKLKKVAAVRQKAGGETVSYGGGIEDWGAGRLIRADLVGIRVSTDREQRALFDRRFPR